ncbi:MFS transporter [Deinococcus peraridilitoris]|uniref:Arabinose efflux permease family protein n=1 Tax=Deinococcus peraridilitoris (strain DSM 19664 / LMG 22246 / CIP 109416 / KR-200) TaxID=937777 RepID=L0A5U7_DEIPD|nr:MFS transporter [Deinococcus peraridilitoris]AFZ68819.1 arabinose efflux permease family protein [Deinococcus peraridilitoris DSM 19664]
MTNALTKSETIDSAIDRIGLGRFQWRLLAVGGLTWAADAMEVLLAGFALPGLVAEFAFPRTGTNATLFVSAAFVGMFFGALFWGPVADRIGRRRVLLTTVFLGVLFGLATALAPSFALVLLFRFLTGFAIGGTLPVDYALIAEYVPTKVRGRFLVYLESFWALGTIAVAGLSWWLFTSLPPEGAWRWVVGLAALPGLVGLWIRRTIPESPRYLALQGKRDEAREVLRQVAAYNGSAVDIGELAPPAGRAGTPLSALWKPALVRRTVLLSVTWFCLSLGYYGIFTWLPTFFRLQGLDLGLVYRNTLILALAQIPGYILAAYLVERVGRRPTLAGFLLVGALASFLFTLVGSGVASLVVSALLSAALLGAWGALYAFTPELYPTESRSTGMGWVSSMARLASIFAPTVGAVLLTSALPLALSIYASFFVVGALAVLFIGQETRGRRLSETAAEASST